MNVLTEDPQVLQVLATEVQNLFTKKGKKSKSSSKAHKHAGHNHTAAKGGKASKHGTKAGKHAGHNHTKEKKGKASKHAAAMKMQTGTAEKHHQGGVAGMQATLGVMVFFIAVGAAIKHWRIRQRNGFDVIEEEPAEPAKENTPLLA